jgi:hypothetical protein
MSRNAGQLSGRSVTEPGRTRSGALATRDLVGERRMGIIPQVPAAGTYGIARRPVGRNGGATSD